MADEQTYFLSALILLPLFGAFLLFFFRAGTVELARTVAGAVTLLTLYLSIRVLDRFQPLVASFQFTENYTWIPRLGIRCSLGIDGISLWLVILTGLLTFLVVFASASIHSRPRSYLAFILLLESGMMGTFLARDGILFYVFWELMLIPMYFLIGIWGGKRRIYAALKFVLYTALGSLLMLVAIVYLGWLHGAQFGELSFAFADWAKLTLSRQEELWLFAAFALAFAIKVPIFPLHTWLPDAHVEAPTGGSVILAGVLLKMGLYGLIRIGIPVFPRATIEAQPIFAILGVIGIVFGALVAWVQTDMKKLVAYSSVSHLGFCVLGYAAMNPVGLQGCMLQMINHGISTAALFFVVGVLYDRRHTREISEYGGLAKQMPVFSVIFLIFTLSSIGLPLTNGFVGEFLILLGGFLYNPILGLVAVSGVVLGAIYMLSLYRRVVFGKIDLERNGTLEDLNFTEQVVFAPLLLLVFVVGLFPNTILKGIEASSIYHLKLLQDAQSKQQEIVKPQAISSLPRADLQQSHIAQVKEVYE